MARTQRKPRKHPVKRHEKHKTKRKSMRKKYNKNVKRRSKKKQKSLKKQQKGGGVLAAAGVGLALSAIGATIYSGLRLLSRVNDTSIAKRLINSPLGVIPWLPKVDTVDSSEFTKQYLQCVTEKQFMKFIFSKKFYRSKTLLLALKEIHENDPLKHNKDFFRQLSQYYQQHFDETSGLKVNTPLLETSNDPNFIDLKALLLPTAAYTGVVKRGVKVYENDILNSQIALQHVHIYRVIYGLDKTFGESFDEAVKQILIDRNSTMVLRGEVLERIQDYLKLLYDPNEDREGGESFKDTASTSLERTEFQRCIQQKLEECCSKPRGLIDFVSSGISYNSQKQCLVCAQQDCLLYVHDYYFKFLKQSHLNIPLPYKLYILMLVEARICVLSKCISLEAIRQQDKNTGGVEDIIDKIYREDSRKYDGRDNLSVDEPDMKVYYDNPLDVWTTLTDDTDVTDDAQTNMRGGASIGPNLANIGDTNNPSANLDAGDAVISDPNALAAAPAAQPALLPTGPTIDKTTGILPSPDASSALAGEPPPEPAPAVLTAELAAESAPAPVVPAPAVPAPAELAAESAPAPAELTAELAVESAPAPAVLDPVALAAEPTLTERMANLFSPTGSTSEAAGPLKDEKTEEEEFPSVEYIFLRIKGKLKFEGEELERIGRIIKEYITDSLKGNPNTFINFIDIIQEVGIKQFPIEVCRVLAALVLDLDALEYFLKDIEIESSSAPTETETRQPMEDKSDYLGQKDIHVESESYMPPRRILHDPVADNVGVDTSPVDLVAARQPSEVNVEINTALPTSAGVEPVLPSTPPQPYVETPAEIMPMEPVLPTVQPPPVPWMNKADLSQEPVEPAPSVAQTPALQTPEEVPSSQITPPSPALPPDAMAGGGAGDEDPEMRRYIRSLKFAFEKAVEENDQSKLKDPVYLMFILQPDLMLTLGEKTKKHVYHKIIKILLGNFMGVNEENREVFDEICQSLRQKEKEIMAQIIIDTNMSPVDWPVSLKETIDNERGLQTSLEAREKEAVDREEEQEAKRAQSGEISEQCKYLLEPLNEKINQNEPFSVDSKMAFNMLTQCH